MIVDVFTIRRRRIGEGWEKVPTRVLLIGAFNQQKALVGAFSVIVQPVVEPIEHYTALLVTEVIYGLGQKRGSFSIFNIGCWLVEFILAPHCFSLSCTGSREK